MGPSFAVTPARRPGCEETARRWAADLGAPYLARGHRGLDGLLAQAGVEALLIAAKEGPQLYTREGGRLAYHLGMAVLRWQRYCAGGQDHFLAATALTQGSRLLDCTLGLAGDAALAGAVVGAEGQVLGLEASPLLYFLTSYGLQHYVCEDPALTAALRRLKIVQAVAADYLAHCKEEYDVVYFDPMFRRHLAGSAAMDAVQPLAYRQPLSREVLELALKVAPRVVIKEGEAGVLASLGCTACYGGKYAKVKYGLITR